MHIEARLSREVYKKSILITSHLILRMAWKGLFYFSYIPSSLVFILPSF